MTTSTLTLSYPCHPPQITVTSSLAWTVSQVCPKPPLSLPSLQTPWPMPSSPFGSTGSASLSASAQIVAVSSRLTCGRRSWPSAATIRQTTTQANGIVKRCHRQLRSLLIASTRRGNWSLVLLLVLLDIRSSLKNCNTPRLNLYTSPS